MVRKRKLASAFFGLAVLCIGTLAFDDEKNDFLSTPQSNCGVQKSEESPKWIVHGGFILMILCIVSMFWGLTIITEKYCLPAIFIFCKRNKIPDDVAGSLFIGTGLSLPILFSSYVGLFASASNIGVGAVLGGNILNLTVNIAGSILAAPNRRLKLDKATLTREIFFSSLSNILIILCLHQDFGESFKSLLSTNWSQCLSVPWQYSLLLISGYLFYCLVVSLPLVIATLQRSNYCIFPMFNPTGAESSQIFPVNEAIMCSEPTVNSKHSSKTNPQAPLLGSFRKVVRTMLGSTNDIQKVSDNFVTNTMETERLSDEENGRALEFILYKKNRLYSYFNFSEVWEPRHCHIDTNGGMSYRMRKEQSVRGMHVTFIDLFHPNCIVVKDESNYQFDIFAQYPDKRRFMFKASDMDTFNSVTNRLKSIKEIMENKSEAELRILATESMRQINWKAPLCSGSRSTDCGDALTLTMDVAEELFVPPEGIILKCFYYIMQPMRYMIYYSTPDVRPVKCEYKAIRCIMICISWMGIQTYLLITMLNAIGDLIHVNGSIMGLTFASIAASYPAFMSSIVLATDGYGDAAITNAMGSNVFNNFIGLGLPWLTYSLVNEYQEYGGIQDGGIVLALVVLTAILILFYGLLACSNFELQFWLVPILFFVYAAYITFLCYYSTLV